MSSLLKPPPNQPKVVLSNIDYLIVSIFANPGKSQRWHLRRLHMYKRGYPDPNKGGTGCAYFRRTSGNRYPLLWEDQSDKNVICRAGWSTITRSKESKMFLTIKGHERLTKILEKHHYLK